MTVFELQGILNEAIERGLGELPVMATINVDASTEIQDVAYGDVYVGFPFMDSKVFAITAIKDAFPEAIEARKRAETDWDIGYPDGEVIFNGTRAECDRILTERHITPVDTSEKYKFYTIEFPPTPVI